MLIHMVQHFAAGFGHDDKVLHAHAKLARQVYARLNGEDHARLYGIGVGGAHIALFVIGLTDKVAQAVVEVLAIARFGDQVTGGGVNIAQAHAGVDHRLGGFVGLAHQVMDGGILRLRLPAEECAGHIGAVTVLAAAHIEMCIRDRYCNFGCGTVTCNYDGEGKYRTTIGDYAFIGCNTNLVAPVKVGSRAFTAAGSTIGHDVPDGALGIERAKQAEVAAWGAKKLEKYVAKKQKLEAEKKND